MRVLIIGDESAPRTAAFQRALGVAGLPAAPVISYANVLAHEGIPRELLSRDTFVRFDAPASDDGVRLVSRDRWAQRFQRAVHLAWESARGACAFSADPFDISTMFDKFFGHRSWGMIGVPSAPFVGEVKSFDELPTGRFFLKPVNGSSGAGIVALQLGRDRAQAWTTVENDGGMLYNTRRIRVLNDRAEIAGLVNTLCQFDRMIAERWVPKASIGGKAIDLRMVVVAGKIVHSIVRASASPITNLHLLNERLAISAIRDRIRDDVWSAAEESCLRAARFFPSALWCGVDLAFTARFRSHVVFEVNAFGDFIRGAEDHIYAREIEAMLRQSR